MSKPQKPRGVSRGPEEAATYEVGYGRPPIASRFQPGQCGNPKGRPRKVKSLAAEIERELDAKIIVREGGIARKLPKRTIISRQLTDSACRGDIRATRTLNQIVSHGSKAEMSSPSAEVPAQLPLAQADVTIIAAFAALIRSGCTISDELTDAAPAQLSAPSGEVDEMTGSPPNETVVH
jgi:hypothetical protein